MLVEDDRPDVQIWNDTINNSKSLVDENKVASFTGAWLVVECYMYRKIYEAFALRSVRVKALEGKAWHQNQLSQVLVFTYFYEHASWSQPNSALWLVTQTDKIRMVNLHIPKCKNAKWISGAGKGCRSGESTCLLTY